jgi:hypothetical protein
MFLRLFRTGILIAMVQPFATASDPLGSLMPKCDFKSAAQLADGSAAVFSGSVIKVSRSEQTQIVRLAVTKSWKGVRTTEVILTNDVHHEGPFFSKGRSYLVFADYRRGKLTTGRCSGTVDLKIAYHKIPSLDRWKAHRKSRWR